MRSSKLQFGLFHKALILVALPVVFQLIFLVCESEMLRQAEREVKLQTCARSLLAHVRALTKSLTSGAAIGYETISGRLFLERYQKAIAGIPSELKQLEELGRLDGEQLQKVRRFGELIEELKQRSDEGRRLLDKGKSQEGSAVLDSLTGTLASVWTQSEDVLVLVRKIEEENPVIQTKTRQDLQMWLWAGVLFNVLLAIGLAVAFHRSTIDRLSHLMHNIIRLSDGSRLSQPLAGADEIAHLDDKFYEMATSLQEAARKEQELVEKLSVARDEALEASRFKTEFLANMSHELRTPMSAAIGMADLLLDTPVTNEQLEMITGIRKAGDVQLAVINDILDLSKIEAGKFNVEITEFELRPSLDEVVRLLADSARQKSVMLKTYVEPNVSETVKADKCRLRQILLNLTGNAVKFTSHGEVTIGVTVDEGDEQRGHLRFAVTDSGIGLSPAAIARMFKPYSQADDSVSRRYGGTGLGLCISKSLVELMGGQIGVESMEGKGSTFWFTLPHDLSARPTEFRRPAKDHNLRAVETTEKEPANIDAEKVLVHPGKLILVAEDDEFHRQITGAQLRKLGYALDIAANGREAIDAISRKGYSLVLMDCEMPELNGFEATRAIRETEAGGKRRMPVVAMTANAVEGYREQCLAAGMDDYVIKPATILKLKEVLQRWIRDEAPAESQDRACTTEEASTECEDVESKACSGEPVDIHELFELLDRQAAQELLRSFLCAINGYMGEMESPIGERNREALRRVVHKFKGACSSMQAAEMVRDVAELETALRDADWGKVDCAYAALRVSSERAQRFLKANLVDGS